MALKIIKYVKCEKNDERNQKSLYKAFPLSHRKVIELANIFRMMANIDSTKYVDILDILENIIPKLFDNDFNYRIGEDWEFKENEYAFTNLANKEIVLTNEVYVQVFMGVEGGEGIQWNKTY